MLGAVSAFFAGLFSSSKMQDTAIDALRKIGGLDEMNAKEKSEYILAYMAATKHQSTARRLIAFMFTMAFMVLLLTWLVSAGLGYYAGIMAALEFAGAVKIILVDLVVQPVNLILTFYFLVQVGQKLKG